MTEQVINVAVETPELSVTSNSQQVIVGNSLKTHCSVTGDIVEIKTGDCQEVRLETQKNEVRVFLATEQGLPGPPGEQGIQGEIGPRGPQGIPGAGVTQIAIESIAAGHLVVVDAVEMMLGQGIRWALVVADGVAGLCRTSDVSGVLTSTGPKHVHYAMTGDRINYGVHVEYDNQLMTLSIENLHANSVSVSVVRIFINNS